MRLAFASTQQSRRVRLTGVRALSAALLSVLALLAIFHFIYSPSRPHTPQKRAVGFAPDDGEDEKLVHGATVLETETLVLQPVQATALLVVLHRCGHSSLQWWHTTLGCFNCFGLPEEIRIVRAALRRGMGVIAVKSISKRRCWDTHHGLRSNDLPHIQREIKRVESLMGWNNLPRYALGVSEGGAMALIAAQSIKFQGVCSMVAGVAPSILLHKPSDTESKETWRYPAAIFVHMARDKTTAAWIEEDMHTLHDQGIPAKEITVAAQPLYEAFLSDRVPGLPLSASAAVFRAFQESKLVGKLGILLKDPRPHSEIWKEAVKHASHRNLTLTRQQVLGVQQELNVAYAGHEVTAEPIEEVFDWLENQPTTHAQTTFTGAYLPHRRKHVDEHSLP